MNRDLLFDGVLEAEAEARANGPQVWQSVLDIPADTLVKPARGTLYLYINMAGRGWWLGDSTADIRPDRKELDKITGWKLNAERVIDCQSRAPFTEVDVLDAPRVWTDVFAIPGGTLVRPEKRDDTYLLYITRSGEGWWIDENRSPASIRNEMTRADRSGWTIGVDEEGIGPFTEVEVPR